MHCIISRMSGLSTTWDRDKKHRVVIRNGRWHFLSLVKSVLYLFRHIVLFWSFFKFWSMTLILEKRQIHDAAMPRIYPFINSKIFWIIQRNKFNLNIWLLKIWWIILFNTALMKSALHSVTLRLNQLLCIFTSNK